jgi:hypothetical protein
MRAYRIIWTKQPATESIIAAESEGGMTEKQVNELGAVS